MDHIPVFENKIIDSLDIKPQGTYVDLTLGSGGHSLGILQRLDGGTLVSFDLDRVALQGFRLQVTGNKVDSGVGSPSSGGIRGVEKVSVNNNTVYLVNRNFTEVESVLKELGLAGADGIIADLGWSTEQLSRVPGFSYSGEESELDMRLDDSLGVKASDLLNGLYPKELSELFSQNSDIYGGELRKLVSAIMEQRKVKPILTNHDLLQVIESAFATATSRKRFLPTSKLRQAGPGGSVKESTRNMPARVFQALRIAVNHELSALQSMLQNAWNALLLGRLLVITFHSGEDKIVGKKFAQLVSVANAEYVFESKFVRPNVAELQANLRARSAKLWGISKN